MDLVNPAFADTRHRKFLCTLSDALCDTDPDVGTDPSHGQPRKNRTRRLFAVDGHGRLLRSALPLLVPCPGKKLTKGRSLMSHTPVLWEETVQGGATWSHVLKRGTALRI